MLKYKHVLLATDLSEETDKIADSAASIARRSHAKISIIHVLEHTPIVYGGASEFTVPLDINLEEKLTENAQKALAVIASRIKIPVENQYIAHGSIKNEISSYAKRHHIDLIVIGSHGQHGIQVLLGSTANAILHAAPCDVLAVRVQE